MRNNNVNNIGMESSSLEKENHQELRTPEELFAEIIQSSTEYTLEKPEILSTNKTKLLSALKTHRPIKISFYQYGLSQNLGKNHRLIVFEWNDRERVREYSKKQNCWRCTECHTIGRLEELLPSYLHFLNGILFVPIKHECPPRDYKLVMHYQRYLEEGNTPAAKRMSQKVNFQYGQNSYANIVNVLNGFFTSKNSDKYNKIHVNNSKNVAKTSASLKRKFNDNNSIVQPSIIKKPKLKEYGLNSEIKNVENDISSVPKTKSNKQLLINNEPGPSSKYKDTVENIQTKPSKIYSFQIPSTFQLQEICKKLGIKYCKEAREFWKEIHFRRIDPSLSANIKTQKFKTKNFYKILSNFFTGKFCDYGQIYYAINSAFSKKLVFDGQMSYEDIDLLCSSYTVTDQHLKFIAKYIPCRILIFDRDAEDGIRRFGKWKNDGRNNILTLVLSFSKRKYSVVVDL